MDPIEFLMLSPLFQDNSPIVDIFFVLCFVVVSGIHRKRREREWFKFPRSSHNWTLMQNDVWFMSEAVRDRLWYREYRMKYSTFCTLCDLLKPFVQRSVTCFRHPIEIERAVAMVLHKLAYGDTSRRIANMYCVGATTVYEYTLAITEALANKDKLFSRFIQVPTGERLHNIIQGFTDLTGLPNMCGAIDGSYIKLQRKPPLDRAPADYWNRHDHHSVLLQAVCDHNLNFWDVCVNAPGGTHDATHLRSSSLYKAIMRREVLQEPVVAIGNVQIRPYSVGDSAYPLLASIQKPFTASGSRDAQKDAFDKAMRRGRVKIENSFGILKNRWRVLRDLNCGLEYTGQIILACCVLHNFCRYSNDCGLAPSAGINEHLYENDFHIPGFIPDERISSRIGHRIRTTLFNNWQAHMMDM